MALFKTLCIAIFFRNVATFDNIAHGKTATQSTTYLEAVATRAIDGGTNQSYSGRSCAHTGVGQSQAWWRLDLGERYSIYNIVIYYRTDGGNIKRFKGFHLYISDESQPKSGYLCYHHTDRGYPDSIQNITCNYPGQYVVLYQDYQNDKLLELCEVEVYGCLEGRYSTNCDHDCSVHCSNRTCGVLNGNCSCKIGYTGNGCTQECALGFYGDGCRRSCSQCKFSSCHHKTGDCRKGCVVGRQGLKCNQACDFGTYGDSCQNKCHCSSGDCNKVSGLCPGRRCKSGWKSETCSQECDHGTFGENCLHTCHCLNGVKCDRITGQCPFNRCDAGWKPGTCSQGCDHGTFGIDCSTRCHCQGRYNCNKTTGRCPNDRCEAGWKPNTCSQECDHGTFGENCLQTCHCLNGKICDRATGQCPSGRCEAGWELDSCSKQCDHGTFGENCNELCHCFNGQSCDRTSGQCPSERCEAGWKPDTCSQACDEFSFGENCRYTCHCLNNTSCDKSDGTCAVGSCDRGWYGSSCNQSCPLGSFGFDCKEKCTVCSGNNCHPEHGACLTGCAEGRTGEKCTEIQNDASNAAVVVGVIVPFIVIPLVGIAVYVYRKRRQSNGKSPTQQASTSRLNNIPSDHSNEDAGQQYANVESRNLWQLGTVSMNSASRNQKVTFEVKDFKTEETNNVYFNTQIIKPDSKGSILVKDLPSVVEKKMKSNELEKEFSDLKALATHPHEEATKPENKPKNRYLTTFPYDHSRVKLTATKDTDYINANFIKSFYNERAYIATQGPKMTTMNDFWQMIWQEDVGKIVMVTKLREGEKKKCEKYWPNSITEPLKLDTFTIDMDSEREHTVYIRRNLCVTHKKTKQQKTVFQFHFTQWPDHGVPDRISLVKLHRDVKSAKIGSKGPLVVHCSAGLGRTGTYLALDALFEVGEKTGAVNVKHYTEIMRQDRMNMIQNLKQYQVVHEALVEVFTVKNTAISVTDFLQTKGRDQKKMIQKEFQELQANKPRYGTEKYTAGNRSENISKNSVPGILPHDDYRPFLMSYGRSRNDYINAVIIPGYNQTSKFIVTQCPLTTTCGDFWSLIYDMHSSNIVLLEQTNKDVNLFPSDDRQVATYDNFVVSKTQCSSTEKLSVSVKHKRYEEARNVTIHINTKWSPQKAIPSSVKQMVEFLENVSRDQEKTKGPLVIVCRDGCTRSGVFATLSLVLEQIIMDDEVDIFQAVRRIQAIRPEFTTRVEQYEFCYQSIEEYLSKDTLYANT